MKVLGLASDSTGYCWAILNGDQRNPHLLKESGPVKKLLDNGDESERLFALKKLTRNLLHKNQVERIAILQAVGSQYGGPSTERVKAECVFQLAAKEEKIDAILVSPRTLSHQTKKFPAIAGDSPEKHFNRGKKFRSKVLGKAVLAGWVGLG